MIGDPSGEFNGGDFQLDRSRSTTDSLEQIQQICRTMCGKLSQFAVDQIRFAEQQARFAEQQARFAGVITHAHEYMRYLGGRREEPPVLIDTQVAYKRDIGIQVSSREAIESILPTHTSQEVGFYSVLFAYL